MENENLECALCHGKGEIKVTAYGPHMEKNQIMVSCHSCNGKGYTTKAEREEYYRSWNI